jgi:4-hydroxy-tetrahydrodipicolinate synthase
MDADTFLRLAEHPGIVAIKEASANLDQIARICREVPDGVAVLSGDDAWTLPIMAMGGHGIISVCSNEIPGEMAELCAAAAAGDFSTARTIHNRFLPLFQGNFKGGPNPVPVKGAMQLMGLLATDAMRLPMLPLDDKGRAAMAATLREVGLLDAAGNVTGLAARYAAAAVAA